MERAEENLTYDAWLLLVTLDSQLECCLRGILFLLLVQKVTRRVSSFLRKCGIGSDNHLGNVCVTVILENQGV